MRAPVRLGDDPRLAAREHATRRAPVLSRRALPRAYARSPRRPRPRIASTRTRAPSIARSSPPFHRRDDDRVAVLRARDQGRGAARHDDRAQRDRRRHAAERDEARRDRQRGERDPAPVAARASRCRVISSPTRAHSAAGVYPPGGGCYASIAQASLRARAQRRDRRVDRRRDRRVRPGRAPHPRERFGGAGGDDGAMDGGTSPRSTRRMAAAAGVRRRQHRRQRVRRPRNPARRPINRNLYFVLDRSGSMNDDDKWHALGRNVVRASSRASGRGRGSARRCSRSCAPTSAARASR